MKRIIITFVLIMTLALSAVTASAQYNDEGKLNLNVATMEQLVAIPVIDEELATAILELREENEEFVDIEELMDIDGIDNKKLRELQEHIFLEPASDCNC